MKIALDVDDVIAAFTPHVHKYFKKELEKCDYWSESEMTEKYGSKGWFMDDVALNDEFWRTLLPLSKPEDIDFDFSCYMSSLPSHRFGHRLEWLQKNGFPDRPLVISRNKLKDCKHLGIDVLVDDKPQAIKELQGSGVVGIHFLTSYASFDPVGDKFVTNLNQVKKFL